MSEASDSSSGTAVSMASGMKMPVGRTGLARARETRPDLVAGRGAVAGSAGHWHSVWS
ncbi:MAG: hypothetical protein R3D43_03590 [Tepidamorphaceae bacterium]